MKTDEYGEIHPSINSEICINCGLCKKCCPSVNSPEYNYPLNCYAAFVSNKDKRRLSASGGIGNLISEYTIRVLNGIVFGTRYDSGLIPITVECRNLHELYSFKGSKYVQSIVGNSTFKLIRDYLIQGKWITYIATPCQIAGLESFLQKDFPRLITVDLICHGVTPTLYFKEEIDHWRTKFPNNCITDVRFRGNDKYNFCFSLWEKQKILLNQSAYSSYYFGGFLWGITLRENCYSCKYARPERVSDITIGDFIGLARLAFGKQVNNSSSITINTTKGKEFFQDISKYYHDSLECIERTYEERLKYPHSLIKPFPRHPLNEKFRKSYLKYGYLVSSRKVMKKIVMCARIKRRMQFLSYSYRIPRKILRIIHDSFSKSN